MKIIIENKYGRYEINEGEDLNIHEIMDLFERLLMSSSYNPSTIKDGFLSKAEEIEDNEENKNVEKRKN